MELTFTIWDADNDGMDQYLGHYTFVKQELKNLLQTKQNLSQKAMQKLGKLGKKQSKKKGKPGTNNNNPLFKCVKIENDKRNGNWQKDPKSFLTIGASLELRFLDNDDDDQMNAQGKLKDMFMSSKKLKNITSFMIHKRSKKDTDNNNNDNLHQNSTNNENEEDDNVTMPTCGDFGLLPKASRNVILRSNSGISTKSTVSDFSRCQKSIAEKFTCH